MAAVIGELVPFRDFLVNRSSFQRQQRSSSQTHDASSPRRSTASRHAAPAAHQDAAGDCGGGGNDDEQDDQDDEDDEGELRHAQKDGLSASSSAPATTTPQPRASRTPVPPSAPVADDGKGPAAMAPTIQDGSLPLAATAPLTSPRDPADDAQSAARTRGPDAQPPSRLLANASSHHVVVRVHDLAHVHSLARCDAAPLAKYDISGMPMGDIIEMVAALLTKITTTNDQQHDALQRNAAHQQQASQTSDAAAAMSPLSHSVLAFHGKNVPAITILSYLSRIHKYCPTTYEVFLSLLVYFDRMTERVNDMVVDAAEPRNDAVTGDAPPVAARVPDETDSDLADDDDDDDGPPAASMADPPHRVVTVPEDTQTGGSVACFVVDSFNIHRLIIAGVTCASKFFSDVFYTNSRYAKVTCSPLRTTHRR